MPEYLAPGVYVEEIEMGPKPIEGVSTSTVGFLGQTERGPVEPKLLTTATDFERLYGGFKLYGAGERLASTYLGYTVDGFFRNGGKRCYVGRIEAEGVPTATGDLQGSEMGGETPRVDFGLVPVNAQRSETLTLTNVGDTVLRIDEGSVSGPGPGSVFEVGSFTGTTLDPGASTSVEVTFRPEDTNPVPGETLTIPYGGEDPASPTRAYTVQLVGRGTEHVSADALVVEFGGAVVGGRGVTRRVRLTNVSGETVEFTTPIETPQDAGADVDAFGATVEPQRLQPDGVATVEAEFTPGAAELGDVSATLTVEYQVEGAAAPGTIEIDLAGEATHALVPSEEVLDFGRVDATGAEFGPSPVTLRNRSNVDVTIAPGDVTVANQTGNGTFAPDTGNLTDPIPPNGEVVVDVTFEADDAGRVSADLQFPYQADGDAAPALTVALVGQGPADVGADPLRVDLESEFGGTASADVTVTSHAADPVTLLPGQTAVNDGGGAGIAGFEVEVSTTDPLDDGDQATVTVTFDTTGMADTAHGTVSGDLVIAHEVGGTPAELTLPVTVTVEDPLDAATTVPAGIVTAVGPGVWGRNVVVSVEEGTQYSPSNPVFRLRIRYWARDEDATVARDRGPFNEDRERPIPAPDVEEVYDNLSLSESSPNYVVTQVNRGSSIVEIERQGTAVPTEWDVEPFWLDGAFTQPAPTVDLGDYEGSDTPGERTGLNAFVETDEISIVCAPDENSVDGLTDAVVDHCETLEDRFAILQAAEGTTDAGTLEPSRTSSYAAFYYPWLEVLDPGTNVRKRVPPGGHMAGIYARSDSQRGVHKAPANEQVRGVQALEFNVTKGEQEILNPRGVNVIRSFRGRGIRVWGARTTSSDPLWKYVNVRRLFLYLEESIDEGTQWVVFEPNDEGLWARVRQTLESFLTTVWRDGALMGTTPEEAFFVKCDRSTMTQNDIDNGRLIALIGVAPVKPAEFVVFRIAQWTGGAEGP